MDMLEPMGIKTWRSLAEHLVTSNDSVDEILWFGDETKETIDKWRLNRDIGMGPKLQWGSRTIQDTPICTVDSHFVTGSHLLLRSHVWTVWRLHMAPLGNFIGSTECHGRPSNWMAQTALGPKGFVRVDYHPLQYVYQPSCRTTTPSNQAFDTARHGSTLLIRYHCAKPTAVFSHHCFIICGYHMGYPWIFIDDGTMVPRSLPQTQSLGCVPWVSLLIPPKEPSICATEAGGGRQNRVASAGGQLQGEDGKMSPPPTSPHPTTTWSRCNNRKDPQLLL